MHSRFRTFPRLFLFLVIGCDLAAADTHVLYSLIAPDTEFQSGTDGSLQLAVLNRSAGEVELELPRSIDGVLIAGDQRWPMGLKSADDRGPHFARIASGGFVLRTYAVALPADAPQGDAVLELAVNGGTAVRVALKLGGAEHVVGVAPAGTGTPRRPSTNLVRAQPAANALVRTFADRLAPHEPLYFIYGGDAPAAKFQLSFKYKLFDFRDVAPRRLGRTLQFAFTQRSLWDIDGESSPFYDTSYMPELIYEALALAPEESDQWFTWLGLQAAFKHESNGRDGPLSRSLNVVYVRPVLAFGRLDGWHLLVIPEVFAYASSLEDNAKLKDYRGYGRLNLVIGRNDGPSLMAAFWGGKDFDHGSLQLDLTLPVRTKLLNFETYLLVQYFNGYGESLLFYAEQSETVRAGFSLVR